MHIVSGIPGVICDIDNVLVSGRTQYNHKTQMVLQTMEAEKVTLNEKCQFSTSEVKFLGHLICKEII